MIKNDRITLRHGEIFALAGAKWIGKPGVHGNENAPAPVFCKTVTVKDNLTKAALYVTGLGQYEGFVNGKPLDEKIVFAPTVSNYAKTVYYNIYDLTPDFSAGENTLSFILGRGRYAFNTAGTPWNGETADWIDQVKMIAVIELEYADGRKEYCVTDESWRVRDSGILQDCMYMGETFDARRQDFTLSCPENTDGWAFAAEVKKPLGKLKYDFSEPIRVCERIRPVSCRKLGEKQFVFAFDKYITGWIELRIDCPKDTAVSVQYTEREDEHGFPVLKHAITKNGRLQKDFFISAGEKTVFRPRFSYKGFRYVLIEGIEQLELSDAVGCFMHNDVTSVTDFASSDALINWLHEAFRRTVLCNFHGLSTDTPVFEKHGWGGDAAAAAPGVLFNFDVRRFYRKWAADFLESQTDEGEISVIVPTPGWGLSGKTGWQSVCGPVPSIDVCWPEIVYRLYWCYEDTDALRENYDGLKKYASYLTEYSGNGLCQRGLGDWLAPSGDVMTEAANPPEGPQVVESAYHIRIFERMEQIASALGKAEDARAFAAERQRLIGCFHQMYYDEERGYYHKPGSAEFRQAGNVLALAFGITPDAVRERVMENLLANLRSRDWHPDMGMYTSLYLPIALSEGGHHAEACRVIAAKGYPGYDYIRQKGASTISEAWEYDGCRSACHYAFGAADSWIMTYLAGIQQLAPGYAEVRIDPQLPEDMEYMHVSMDTVRGVVEVHCRRENGKVLTKISAPEEIRVIR